MEWRPQDLLAVECMIAEREGGEANGRGLLLVIAAAVGRVCVGGRAITFIDCPPQHNPSPRPLQNAP